MGEAGIGMKPGRASTRSPLAGTRPSTWKSSPPIVSVSLGMDAVFLFGGLARSDTPANSGTARDGIVNPKLGLVLGPWFDTELFVNYGGGFHSNDARGVVATVDPVSPLFTIARSPGR